jgi:hypothetical protein
MNINFFQSSKRVRRGEKYFFFKVISKDDAEMRFSEAK